MLLRAHTVILLRPNNSKIARFGKSERFRKYCSGMDKQSEDSKNTGDAMSHSFGEGYATRSDEEGFGGVYSSTQQLKKNDKHSDEDSAEYDKTQGSEVKEKEKGRNLHKDTACK